MLMIKSAICRSSILGVFQMYSMALMDNGLGKQSI